MDTAGCVKCITSLLKTLKVIKCVKKVEMYVIAGAIIIISIGMLSDNKKEIGKIMKKLKKKVS